LQFEYFAIAFTKMQPVTAGSLAITQSFLCPGYQTTLGTSLVSLAEAVMRDHSHVERFGKTRY